MGHHRRLDSELDVLRDRVLVLGGEAEAAREVLEGDDAIDRLEVEIDRLCIDVLALRQPAARDLRFVISVAKITPILERLADHACNIARVALDLNDEPQLRAFPDLSRMSQVASAMLRAALDAFTRADAATARRVIERDDEIDVMYERLFRDLIDLMTTEPAVTPRAARLLFVAKHLERVADYVTDICELTVYMTEAAVIKHSYK